MMLPVQQTHPRRVVQNFERQITLSASNPAFLYGASNSEGFQSVANRSPAVALVVSGDWQLVARSGNFEEAGFAFVAELVAPSVAGLVLIDSAPMVLEETFNGGARFLSPLLSSTRYRGPVAQMRLRITTQETFNVFPTLVVGSSVTFSDFAYHVSGNNLLQGVPT
jgi:hypothetical protein